MNLNTRGLQSFQIYLKLLIYWGFPGGSDGKESTWNVADPGLIPGSGRSPGFSFTVIKTVFHVDRRESMERKMVKKQERRNTWWLRSRRLLRTQEYSGWMSFKENLNQQGWKNYLDWVIFICWVSGFTEMSGPCFQGSGRWSTWMKLACIKHICRCYRNGRI